VYIGNLGDRKQEWFEIGNDKDERLLKKRDKLSIVI
jgi:hypothetical protein